MNDDTPGAGSAGAERVYSAPAEALDAARTTLATASATASQRAEAFLVLGRAAYYGNQMSDAVRFLRDAVPLTEDPDTLTEILLTLAPALSKEGHPDEALRLLENPALELEPRHAGQLRNQRGIILTELARLPEAMTQMEEALTLLREAGDDQRETRTLVNLGAVASMMGRLDDAEQWYELAREKTTETGQVVVAAGIEGNLGYVESRRGNFATALGWYDKARANFEGLGDVDLLVAVLEVDHARTLLDVGLVVDAVDAAELAARSAVDGGNQMLETQAQLLIAEAKLRLGEDTGAAAAARRAGELAAQLGQRPWELRATYLAPETELDDYGGIEHEVDQFLRAGWVREAFESALMWAKDRRRSHPEQARSLLERTERRTGELDVDPVDRALAALVIADVDADPSAGWVAFEAALEALREQRALLGSVEMRAVIAHRARTLTDMGLSLSFRTASAADAALDVLERTRMVRTSGGVRDPSWVAPGDLSRLRDARVRLEEAKLEGGDVGAATAAVRRLERDVLRSRRSLVAHGGPVDPDATAVDVSLPPDTVHVTYAVHDDRILGVVRVDATTTLVDLGELASIRPLVREQRAALRRLADQRRDRLDRDLERMAGASTRIDRMLLRPLPVDDPERIVLTPATQLRDVAWCALPTLRERPVTLATALTAWNADREPLVVRSFGFLGGPGLAGGERELDDIGELWQHAEAVVHGASSETVMEALGRADLVHLAAHGSFRADNAFFSAIRFEDGPLSILEMSELERLPAVVVLASCDAATAGSVGGDADVVVGTATELRNLGARVVVAPSMVVNDGAAADFATQLHRSFVVGRSVDEAMVTARRSLIASDDPRRVAAAGVFHLFGGRSTREPLRVLPSTGPALR